MLPRLCMPLRERVIGWNRLTASADKIGSQALNLGDAWERGGMEYFAGVVILIILLIWRVKRNASNLQKMCWIFFQQYVHLGDEKAKCGFQHIYIVFADEMKREFRGMMDFQMVAFDQLMEETPKEETVIVEEAPKKKSRKKKDDVDTSVENVDTSDVNVDTSTETE